MLGHAYAIVRVDDFLGDEVPVEQRVTVTRVVDDYDFAVREVARLNKLQDGKGVRYFSQATRVGVSTTGNEELS